MEKFCPSCSRVYGEEATHCEVEGERLVILREEPSLVGHVLDGKYTLHAKLGEGGMGSVYLAEQATMGREVAIKVLRREFSQNRIAIKRFLREARAASKLGHPNTITVYDFGQSNEGLLYLVMERLSGRPLSDILDDDGAMDLKRAIHIMAQICDSLSEAHLAGITHRDLKPENIFIEQKAGNPDFVKVLDFGIAKMQGEEVTQATATGMICGTPSYMSPEQAMGRDIDGRSDIYALGILLYEMLTDEKPFDGDTPMEVMLKHINEPPPNVFQRTDVAIPEGIQVTLDAALSKKAKDRPADCQVLKSMLLEGMHTPLTGPITSTQDPKLSKRRRDGAAERASSQEKTGLSPAAIVSDAYDDDAIIAKKSKWWMFWAAILLLAGGGAAAFAAMSGDNDRVKPAVFGESVDGAVSDHLAVTASDGTPNAKPLSGEGNTTRPDDPSAVVPPVAPTTTTSGTIVGTALPVAAARGIALQEIAATRVAPATVSIQIESEPAGARVMEGTTVLGETPLTITRPTASGVVTVNLRKRGYRNKDLTIETGADSLQSVQLIRTRRSTGPRSGSKSGTKKPDGDKQGGWGSF